MRYPDWLLALEIFTYPARRRHMTLWERISWKRELRAAVKACPPKDRAAVAPVVALLMLASVPGPSYWRRAPVSPASTWVRLHEATTDEAHLLNATQHAVLDALTGAVQ